MPAAAYLLSHNCADYRRVGLRLVDVGNMVHASDTTGLLVITEVQRDPRSSSPCRRTTYRRPRQNEREAAAHWWRRLQSREQKQLLAERRACRHRLAQIGPTHRHRES